MDVSRSGRIRKKSSKLADFESPDDVEVKHGKEPTKSKRAPNKDYPSGSVVMDDPDEGSPEDLDELQEADYDIKEEDFDEIPSVGEGDDDNLHDVDVETGDPSALEVESLKIDPEEEDDEDGNLMIDENRGKKSSKSKAVSSSLYFSEKKKTHHRHLDGGKVHAVGKKVSRRDKGKPRFTAYMLWAKAQRDKVASDNPGLNFAGISKRLGEIWSSVPMSEKWAWKRRANLLCSKTMRQHSSKPQQAENKSKVDPHLHPCSRPAAVAATADAPPVFKVTGTEPLDCAAHLKLLGESLSVIGERLTEHEGQIAVSGSLSVLLDSLLCSVAPLLCLTQQLPELNGIHQETLNRMLDNIAYIMPGL